VAWYMFVWYMATTSRLSVGAQSLGDDNRHEEEEEEEKQGGVQHTHGGVRRTERGMINVGQLTTFTPVPQAALSLLLSRLDHDAPARPPTLEPNTNSYKKRGCSCARLGISCSINN
jgi:hypothetical protein